MLDDRLLHANCRRRHHDNCRRRHDDIRRTGRYASQFLVRQLSRFLVHVTSPIAALMRDCLSDAIMTDRATPRCSRGDRLAWRADRARYPICGPKDEAQWSVTSNVTTSK